jgi:predicted kinase
MYNETIKFIHSEYIKTLKYYSPSILNDKVILTFSGVPGSGKTTLAKRIEDKFKAIRLNNDDIREIILRLNPQFTFPQIQELLYKYLEFFFIEIIKQNNQFIILDSSIDRTYEKVKGWADDLGFRLIIIRIKSDKELIVKRINERNGKDAHLYLEKMDGWIEDNGKFNSQVNADLTINSDYLNLDDFFRKLRSKLES